MKNIQGGLGAPSSGANVLQLNDWKHVDSVEAETKTVVNVYKHTSKKKCFFLNKKCKDMSFTYMLVLKTPK